MENPKVEVVVVRTHQAKFCSLIFLRSVPEILLDSGFGSLFGSGLG